MDSKSFNHDKNSGNGKSFQILNSIYGTYLLADGKPIFDVGEITRPLSNSSRINLDKICVEFREFLEKHPLDLEVDAGSIILKDQLLKVSGSAGPNHRNAQVSALADAHSLKNSKV